MKLLILAVVMGICGFMYGCANGPATAPVQSTTTTLPTVASTLPELAWKKPEWTKFLVEQLSTKHYDSFSKASDNEKFCPKFKSLTKEQKVHVWSEMLVWVMYYESGWKPTSWMKEDMGIDPITKVQVKSEGLLQLSYQDMQWAKFCKFDWSKDKHLKQDDPKKTIFDPYLNMDCGLGIMARQIDRKGSIMLSSGVYWAVLKIGGKFTKIDKITAKTKALPFCK